MGGFNFQVENTSTVGPSKLFKAFVLDSTNLIPKAMEGTKIEILQGNGGPGTLKKLSYAEGGETKYVVEKVEVVDEPNFVYNYSVVEGSDLAAEGVEKITFETKFEGAGNGTVAKASITYYTKSGAPPSEEAVAASKAKGVGYFRAVEAYLLAHPEY